MLAMFNSLLNEMCLGHLWFINYLNGLYLSVQKWLLVNHWNPNDTEDDGQDEYWESISIKSWSVHVAVLVFHDNSSLHIS